MGPSGFYISSVCLLLVCAGCAHVNPYTQPGFTPPAPGAEQPAAATISTRVILLGDAGDSESGASVLLHASAIAAKIPSRSVIVYLGDNIYPDGFQTNNP